MLSKKYYILLADLIGNSRDLYDFTSSLVVSLKMDNPKFDIAKFINRIEYIRAGKKVVR